MPNKNRQKKKRRAEAARLPPESPISLGITVGWLLSGFSAFAADCLALAAWGWNLWMPFETVAVLKNLTLFIGLVAGVMTIVLMLVAARVRPTPAPRSVVVVSWLVSATALLLIFVL